MFDERCGATRSNGPRCQAWPVNGSAFCQAHEPARAAQMAEARRRGGRNAHPKILSHLPDISLDSPEATGNLIDQTISMVRRGEIADKTATTIGYLVNVRWQVREKVEHERRIEELEHALLATRGDAEEGRSKK